MNWVSLIVVLVSLIIFYVKGSIILLLFRIRPSKDSYYDTFNRLMVGISLSTLLYACVKTQCNTILLGFFLIGVCYFYYVRKKGVFDKSLKFKDIFKFDKNVASIMGVFFLIGIFFFVIRGITFYNYPFNYFPHPDYGFYSILSQTINDTGVESYRYVYNPFNQSFSASPYHYFELWLNAGIASYSNVSMLETLVIIVYTILATVFAIGMISLTRIFTKNIWMQIISVFATFFVSITNFDFNVGFNLLEALIINGSEYSIMLTTKTLVFGIFYIWTLIELLREKDLFFFPLMLLAIANFVSIPVVFFSLFLFTVYISINNKSFAFFLKGISFLSLLSFFIFAFYFFQAQKETIATDALEIILKQFKTSFSILKSILKLIVFVIIYNIIYWGPILILYLFNKNKRVLVLLRKTKKVYLFLWAVLVSGFVTYQLMAPMRDSHQFFTLPIMIITIVGFLLLLMCYVSWKNNKWIRVGIVSYILIVCFFNIKVIFGHNMFICSKDKCSQEYMINIKNQIDIRKNFNYSCAILKDTIDLQKESEINPAYETQSNYIYNISDSLNLVSLNTWYCPSKFTNNMFVQHSINSSPFKLFMTEYQLKNGKSEIELMQYEFVKKYDIDFIILTRNAKLPLIFNDIIDTIYIDNLSGDECVFLEKK